MQAKAIPRRRNLKESVPSSTPAFIRLCNFHHWSDKVARSSVKVQGTKATVTYLTPLWLYGSHKELQANSTVFHSQILHFHFQLVLCELHKYTNKQDLVKNMYLKPGTICGGILQKWFSSIMFIVGGLISWPHSKTETEGKGER